MRERSNANRGAGESNTRRQSVDERVLEAARWPEQDPLWDIEKWEEINRVEPAVSFVKGEEEPPHQAADIAKWEEANTSEQAPLVSQTETNHLEQIRFVPSRNETSESSPQVVQPEARERDQTRVVTKWDEADTSPSSLRPFHAHQDKSESGNTAWIAGAIVAGLLAIAGGIYAYENWANHAPAPTPAMPIKTAPPSEMPSASPGPVSPAPPAVPDIRPIPPASPTIASPIPNRAENGSISRLPRSVPPEDDPINAPMTLTPETAPPPQGSTPAGPAATQQPVGAPVLRSSSEPPAVANDPINAPMTLTPETAPPPQPSPSLGQAGSQ